MLLALRSFAPSVITRLQVARSGRALCRAIYHF